MSGWIYEKECVLKDLIEMSRYINFPEANLIIAELIRKGINRFLYYQHKKEIEKDSGMGVYLIVRDLIVKYIGTTDNLRTRIQKHDKEHYYPGCEETKQRPDEIIFMQTEFLGITNTRLIQHGLICLIRPKLNSLERYNKIR